MNTKYWICIFCLIFTVVNYGQGVITGTETEGLILLQSIQIDAYNSIGFSDITNAQISEIGSANPASLSNFNGLAAGIGFQNVSDISYFMDLKIKRPNQIMPSALGMIYPLDNFRIGLSYHQKYSGLLDFGIMPIRTIERPEGTGEFYTASNELVIYSPSALASYSNSNVLLEEDRLTFGIQLFWDYVEAEDKIWKQTFIINTNDISWKIGIQYDINTKLGFGLLFEKGIDMEGEVKVEEETLDPDPIDTTAVIASYPSKYTNIYRLPNKLSIGYHYWLLDNLMLSSNLTYVFWNALNNAYKDQPDFSIATQIAITENISTIIGMYFTDRKLVKEDNYNNPQHATYYNLGLKAKFENYIFIAEAFETNYSSADYREQTILKLGFDYMFDTQDF